MDTPARWNGAMHRASESAFVSSAISRLVYGPGGWLERPTPRLSKVTTRNPAATKSLTCIAHPSRSSPTPFTSTSVSVPSPLIL
jgi:hypothetical protein